MNGSSNARPGGTPAASPRGARVAVVLGFVAKSEPEEDDFMTCYEGSDDEEEVVLPVIEDVPRSRADAEPGSQALALCGDGGPGAPDAGAEVANGHAAPAEKACEGPRAVRVRLITV